MKLCFSDELQREFPEEFDLADATAQEVIACLSGQDYSALEAHSPGLKGFDWSNYINLSSIRMVRALRMIKQHASPGAHVLDFGSYFGNCALMLARAGYRVTALDSYQQYGACLEGNRTLMQRSGIDVRDFSSFTPQGQFDAVVLMGVIEHVPHTPRVLLQDVYGALSGDGLLVLDTPNLAYVYNRQKLARGQSIFPPIQSQFHTQLPFEGHHREYTAAELEWILDASGFSVLATQAFNYSIYGLSELAGIDLDNYRAMQHDPSMRELLIYAARRQARPLIAAEGT